MLKSHALVAEQCIFNDIFQIVGSKFINFSYF